MKVYESSHPTKRDYTKVPQTCLPKLRRRQVKIKNQKLEEFGFTAGTEFKIIYAKNNILLKVIEREVHYVR